MLRQRLKDGIGVWYIEALCQGATIGFSEVLIIIWYSRQVKDAVALGLILTLPTAIGAVTQAFATRKKSFTRNPLKLACLSITAQIIGLLTMAISLSNANELASGLIVGQCLYWIGSLTAASPTQEILAQTVPIQQHNRFFSRRAMLMTVITLVCNVVVAVLLDRGLNANVMMWFVSAAAGMRLFSLTLILVHSTPKEKAPTPNNGIVILDTNHNALVSIFKLSFCMALFRCAVNISSPFYSAYMISDLAMTFSIYSMLTAVPLITKTLCLNNWARLLDDNRKFEGLALATFFIGLTPILWSLNASTPWIAGLQIVSGISWSGFDLISVLLIQHMYPRSITSKLGLFLALGSLGSVTGAAIGGVILNYTKSYPLLFTISGVMRLCSGFLLLWYLRRHHLFRFHHLNLKHGLATLITVRPSIEAATKLLPMPLKRGPKPRKAA